MEQHRPIDEPSESSHSVTEQLAGLPVVGSPDRTPLPALRQWHAPQRGPLSYTSVRPSQPLSLEEEAALAFAGCGITGPVLAELPYDSGDEHEAGGGNIMINLVGRTVASGDAVHAVTLFVINDEGAWMLKRPQDYPRTEIAELARAGRATSSCGSTRGVEFASPTAVLTCHASCLS